MSRKHAYVVQVVWTGNRGEGTPHYRAYSREYEISADGKRVVIPGSSDAVFRGDAARYNPEELLVAAISSCHMLWVLHLCADAGIIVTAYSDEAVGSMAENADGSGQFTGVLLRPKVAVRDPAHLPQLPSVHERAHRLCFVSRSVNFPVEVLPSAEAGGASAVAL
jgi:organic hydroperoxide reductase OsmC/OhrA